MLCTSLKKCVFIHCLNRLKKSIEIHMQSLASPDVMEEPFAMSLIFMS